MTIFHRAAILLVGAGLLDFAGVIPPAIFAGTWVAAVVVWLGGAVVWLRSDRSER